MTLKQRGVIAVLEAGSMAGGALGATVINAASGTAATTTSSSGTSAVPRPAYAGPPRAGGRFVPNEDPAHEKGESAQREAEENEGKFPRAP